MTMTDRFALPFLIAGQAQKEVTHNEALAMLDMLVQPVVQSVAPAAVPASPSLGQCWIVGTGATGEWAGHDGAFAGWTSGGWRFVMPLEGAATWSLADSMQVRRIAGNWEVGGENVKTVSVNGTKVLGNQQTAIATPTGGAAIDAEARAAIQAILTALRAHGLIAT